MVHLFFFNIKPSIINRFNDILAGSEPFHGQNLLGIIGVDGPLFYAGDFVEEIGHGAHTVAAVDIGLKLFGHVIFVVASIASGLSSSKNSTKINAIWLRRYFVVASRLLRGWFPNS